jgi:multiple sugar transport system ATP-binding protein
MIAGLDTPSAGTIFIGDRDVTRLASKDRDIAMVFQSYALYPTMSVSENIAFGLEMRNVPRPAREAAVARVARMLQIEHLLSRRPAQLSGGQRQRVAMGRALARDPKLFLFDEPLSNLDAKLRVEMRAEIKMLHQRTRTTTVYVTHDQVEAMTLWDRVAVMRAGRIEQFGTPQQIYDTPATRFVAEFIGSPSMNFIAAECTAEGVSAKGVVLAVSPAQRAVAQGAVLYGLRPEALSLVDQGLPGTVVMVEPTGPETYAVVDTAVGRLTARVAGRLSQQPGDRVALGWRAEDAHLFEATSERRLG